jgi:hypothetical protein
MLVAIVTYFVESIVNGLFGGIVSGLVGFISFGAAGYAAVITAELVAPNAKRAMGVVLALNLALLSAFVIGNALTAGSERQSTTPIWYTVALLIVLVIGAVFGILSDAIPADEHVALRVPTITRWVLFIPIAAAASLAIIIGLVYLGISYPSVQGIIDIETRFLSAIIFISLATAIAPAGRRIVVSILSAPWLIGGFFSTLSALFRPLITPWIEHLTHRQVGFYTPAWIQAIQGLAWLTAALIPLLVIFRSKTVRSLEVNT